MSYSLTDFTYTISGGTCGGENIQRENIKKVLAAWGSNTDCCHDCGSEWSGGFLLKMKDGSFVYVTGWCDYTGWGCQDGTTVQRFDKKPTLKTLDVDKEWDKEPVDLNRWLKKKIEDPNDY